MPITKEDLAEYLQDENNKTEFNELAKSLGYETPEDIEGLRNKNNEVILKLKKEKEERTKLQKTLDEINLDEYYEYKNGADSNGKAQAQANALQKKLESLIQEKTDIESKYMSSQIESQLSQALEATGFKTHKGILKQALQGKAKVENDNGKPIVIIEDENGLPLPVKEYLISFANSEDGKRYLDQPENKGAGSQNISGTSGSRQVTEDDFKKMSPKERASFIQSGGKII